MSRKAGVFKKLSSAFSATQGQDLDKRSRRRIIARLRATTATTELDTEPSGGTLTSLFQKNLTGIRAIPFVAWRSATMRVCGTCRRRITRMSMTTEEAERMATAVAEAIRTATAPLVKPIADLEQRPGLRYWGVWRTGATSQKADAVTHRGALWVANQASDLLTYDDQGRLHLNRFEAAAALLLTLKRAGALFEINTDGFIRVDLDALTFSTRATTAPPRNSRSSCSPTAPSCERSSGYTR